ncbi:MAG: TolC family protein [Bacteroidales bacterium]
MRKSLTLLVIVLTGLASKAQDTLWTLQDCIDYVIENNIALKRQEILRDQYRYDLKEQRAGIMPTLSFETNAYLNYGRSVSPEDNIITFEPNFNNSYSFSSGVTLFNGFAKSNRISAAKFLYKMGREQVETQKNLSPLILSTPITS